MNLTLLKGYPDLIGRRQAFVGSGCGSHFVQSGDRRRVGESRIRQVLGYREQHPTGSDRHVLRSSSSQRCRAPGHVVSSLVCGRDRARSGEYRQSLHL